MKLFFAPVLVAEFQRVRGKLISNLVISNILIYKTAHAPANPFYGLVRLPFAMAKARDMSPLTWVNEDRRAGLYNPTPRAGLDRRRGGVMTRVIDRLHDDHINLARLLHVLEEQIGLFRSGRVSDYDLIGDILDYMLNYPDVCHHPIEDRVYRLLRKRNPATAESLDDLEEQHKTLAERIRRFAAAVRNVRDDAQVQRDWFVAMAEDLVLYWRQHMIAEETQILPAALASLSPKDWAEVEGAFNHWKDPLFGETVGPGYRRLYRKIVRATCRPLSMESAHSLEPSEPRA